MFKVVYCQTLDMAFCHLVQNWRMGTHWVRIISWQLPGWLCSCRWWGEEWVVGGRLGGSPCLLTLRTVVWTVVWTVVSPYNLIISSVYVQTSFGAKSPRPSFYQIFWPLCLQISGANHHNRKLYLQTPDLTQGTKLHINTGRQLGVLTLKYLKPKIFPCQREERLHWPAVSIELFSIESAQFVIKLWCSECGVRP